MTSDEVTAVIREAVNSCVTTVTQWTGSFEPEPLNPTTRINERIVDMDQLPVAVFAALAAAGLVIGERAMLTADDFEAWTVEWQDKDTVISEWFSEMPNGLALVRVVTHG